MFDDIEEVEVQAVAPLPQVNSQQSLMQVRSSFATAVHVQKPRNLKEVEKDFLVEADLAGASFYYGWGVQDKGTGKNKAVEGPSIGLAKSLLRCWGNCAVEMLPVQETPQAYFFTAAFIDLEKGVTLTRPFRQSKNWQVYGKMDAERKEDVRFQIGASKAIRNVIRAALPDWLVNKGIDRAKKGEMAKLEQYISKNGMDKAREAIVGELKKFGVTLDLILAKLERPTINAITKEDMVLLKGDIQALHAGQDSVESLYAFKETVAGQNGNGKSKAESLKEELQSRTEKKPTSQSDDESRKIVTAAGLDANEMMPDGFRFRYILGDNRDAIVDQKTGETLPLAQEAEKQEKVEPQAPQAAREDEKAPYPKDWPERRKIKIPGFEVTWNNKVNANVRFLEGLKKKGITEAAYELAFREANDIK